MDAWLTQYVADQKAANAARAQQQSILDKYIADQAAKGKEVVSLNPYSSSGLDQINYDIYQGFHPVTADNAASNTGQVFRFDTMNTGGTGSLSAPDASGNMVERNNAPVVFQPGQSYALTDAKNEVVGRASTPEEMQALVEKQAGMPYGFNLYKTDAQGNFTPGTQLFGASDPRVGGVMGALLQYGLPLATAFIPGLNVLQTAIASGMASGVGAMSAGKDPLKAGLISAATAGLLKGTPLGSDIGKALDKVPVLGDALQQVNKLMPSGVSSAASDVASNALGNEIVVNAAKSALPGIIGALAPTIASKIPGLSFDKLPSLDEIKQAAPTQGAEGALDAADPLVVNGVRYSDLNSAFDGIMGSVTPSVLNPSASMQPPSAEDQIVVTAKPKPVDATTGAISSAVPSIIDTYTPSTVGPDGEIVVTAKPKPDLSSVYGSAVSELLPDGGSKAPTSTEKTDTKSTLDKVIDVVEAGAPLIPLVESLFGGGGGKSSATIPFGLGAKNPLYSAKLPTPGVNGAFKVGGVGGATGPTAPAGGDWTKFGMGTAAERVKPSDIPQYGGVNPAGYDPLTSQWLGPQETPHVNFEVKPGTVEPVKKAMGGSFAVGGPGDGRSDSIPAQLSDGEYVIDAETVALLGNGSSKAGAAQLDKFRANIRKHKGRNLARGKFSVNAKKPEAYLSGGRS
jgi:hypothetical protein